MAGVDAVVHLGAVPDEAPFERSPARTCTAPTTSSRRAGGTACGAWSTPSSNHATGIYPVGEPLDGTYPPRPDGLYGASKVFGEALGRMYCDRFGLSVVCLRIGSFRPRPRERRELSTWLSHADAVRLVRAALTADVDFAIVYGGSANTRRWWPPDTAIGFAPARRRRGLRRRARGRGLHRPGRAERRARARGLGRRDATRLRLR